MAVGAILEIRDLTLRFGGLTAVSGLNLTVEEGAIVSLIGPNGAGKTSVFNTVTGIYQPTAGKVLFQGSEMHRPFNLRTALSFLVIAFCVAVGLLCAVNLEPLWEQAITNNYVYRKPFPWSKMLPDIWALVVSLPWDSTVLPFAIGAVIGGMGSYAVWKRSRRSPEVISSHGIARTFQTIRLFQQMPVLENILVGMDTQLTTHFWHAALRLPKFLRERMIAKKRAEELLEFVGLPACADLPAASLSYGDQRRLEIARALAGKPRLLLLDEPAAGMNPSEARELMGLIQKIRGSGITVFLIEHQMRVVMGISDRIAVLDYGEKIAEGSPEEIKANPKVIEAYLGQEGAG